MATGRKKKLTKKDQQLLAAAMKIVPFMKTIEVKNPFNPSQGSYRTKYQLHPNERFKKFGTWDKL